MTDTVQSSLAHARFEVLPLRGVEEQTAALPEGTTVTVTSSPSRGIEPTLALAARLRDRGMAAVPHLAARLVADTEQLGSVLERIEGLGLGEVFVIAGDAATPAGQFPDALALLAAMDEIGRRPGRVGITGYPERHAFIPDAATVSAMAAKARHADYIVSQICYDPQVIATWVKAVRARGLSLPIYVGMPGPVDAKRLLRISLKIGLGDSMRFLHSQRGAVGKLLTRYTPDDIVDELAPLLPDPGYGIAGWHFFTFNEVAATLRWRDQLAHRFGAVA